MTAIADVFIGELDETLEELNGLIARRDAEFTRVLDQLEELKEHCWALSEELRDLRLQRDLLEGK